MDWVSRRRGVPVGILGSAAAVAAVTGVIEGARHFVPVLSLGVLYIFAVLPVAVVWGLPLAAAVSVASMLVFNWLFLPPVHTFTLDDSREWLALTVYLVTAVVVSELATRTRRLARQAVEAEVLRQSDVVKTAILRAVGHDLRSPLTAIRAASEGLASRTLELGEEERDELLVTIRTEIRRLDRLVSNLLDLSRLEAGALNARPELWAAEALVGIALEQLGPSADRVRVAAPPELPLLRVDAVQVERVLVNLVENALGVTPLGESVELTIEEHAGRVRLLVRDHGPGIAEADRERIFEPFETGQAGGHGTGLGLAIARGFSAANHGTVSVESGVAGGATFVLELPAAEQPAAVRA